MSSILGGALARITVSAFVLGVLVGLGNDAYSQDLEVDISSYEAPKEVRLKAQAEGPGNWSEESQETFDRCKLGTVEGYDVYYRYNEDLLFSRSEPAILHLFVAGHRTGMKEGHRKVWYQRFRLTVQGNNFIDRTVLLPLRIIKDGVKTEGTIEVVAHDANPRGILRSEKEEGIWIDVPTDRRKVQALAFANRSMCCDIEFDQIDNMQVEAGLWKEPIKPQVLGTALEPKGEDNFQPWLNISLEPQRTRAFWKAFSVADDESPHSEIKFDLVYRIKNGQFAKVPQVVKIRFIPPWYLVALAVILGALVGFGIFLLAATLRPLKEPEVARSGSGSSATDPSAVPAGTTASLPAAGPVGSAKAEPTAVSGALTPTNLPAKARRLLHSVANSLLLKRLFLSVSMALVVWAVLRLLRNQIEITLFGFPLDSSQCLPASFVGFIVSLRPVFFLQSLAKGFRGFDGSPVVWLLVFLLVLLPGGPVHADNTKNFRPVSMAYDARTKTFYVLSSPDNRVYRLTPYRDHLQEIARLRSREIATDLCVIPWRDGTAVAVASSGSQSSDGWISTVSVIQNPGERNLVLFRSFFGFGQFHGLAYDGKHLRLLLTDRTREGIYTAPLTAFRINEPGLRFSHILLNEPTAIAAAGDHLYVASSQGHTVLEVDLATNKAKALLEDLREPASISISPDGLSLLVVDAVQAKVYSIDLATRKARVIPLSYKLREPRSAIWGPDGDLWVTDTWDGVVLRFPKGTGTPQRYVP